MRPSRVDFIRQQGFPVPDSDSSLYASLMLQPRIVACVITVGILLQSGSLFLALSAVLWWGSLLPALNVFDRTNNFLILYARGLTPLNAAPAPRRFAMGMAAAFALAIGVALLAGATITASILEGVFLVAALEVVFVRFCSGAYLYHLVWRRLQTTRRRGVQAVSTCVK
jgi:hypothetical protein